MRDGFGVLVVVLVSMLLSGDMSLRYSMQECVDWKSIVTRWLGEPTDEGWVRVEKVV